MIDGRQTGPLRLDELAEAGVRPDTYVWCKEMDDWRRAREVADICRYFRNRIYDMMHPGPSPDGETVARDTGPDTSAVPLRFRPQIERADPADVDLGSFNNQADLNREPSTWYPFPMLLALVTFLPLGLLAISQARKAKRAWSEGRAADAHEYARRGKMATGMSLSFGLIIIAAIIPIFMH